MGKTYTDFSQLSKGMFRKSDSVEVLRLKNELEDALTAPSSLSAI